MSEHSIVPPYITESIEKNKSNFSKEELLKMIDNLKDEVKGQLVQTHYMNLELEDFIKNNKADKIYVTHLEKMSKGLLSMRESESDPEMIKFLDEKIKLNNHNVKAIRDFNGVANLQEELDEIRQQIKYKEYFIYLINKELLDNIQEDIADGKAYLIDHKITFEGDPSCVQEVVIVEESNWYDNIKPIEIDNK